MFWCDAVVLEVEGWDNICAYLLLVIEAIETGKEQTQRAPINKISKGTHKLRMVPSFGGASQSHSAPRIRKLGMNLELKQNSIVDRTLAGKRGGLDTRPEATPVHPHPGTPRSSLIQA